MSRRRVLDAAIRYAIMVPVALAFVFPFYWMIVTSLNSPAHAFDFPPDLFPRWHFENFVSVIHEVQWGRYIANTILVAGTTTLMVLLTSALAGYAFAAMRLPGKAVVFGIILAAYMVPTEVTLVPNFITLKMLGWYDSYQAQIVPFGASVFGVFLMRQFFLGLPKDLWEAAQLDGAGHWTYLWRVALPLARPALVTVALFTFVAAWNAFLWPLIVTNSDSLRPLQVGLSYFYAGEESHNPVLVSAGALMTTLPVLVIFLFAQRQLVGGIAGTGIRG